MWERLTFVLTSCRSNFSLPLIPVRCQSLQMLDDEIFSTKNCACGKNFMRRGTSSVRSSHPCLHPSTLPHFASYLLKKTSFIDHIDPWFCWISIMFPVPSDATFPYVLPLTLPPLVTCIILHHLAISCLYILLAYSCLLTSSQSLGQKNSAAEKSAERSGASAKKRQIRQISKFVTDLHKSSTPVPYYIFTWPASGHCGLPQPPSRDIMWHHVTSRYLSTSFLHAHFRAASTFYSTCWSNLGQGAQKRETENIGGKNNTTK
jgi:hypothetical protein